MSGSLHVWYGLSELEWMADRGVTLAGELDIAKLTRLADLLHSTSGSVNASLGFVRRRDGWLQAAVEYRASLECICQRCLEPFVCEVADRVLLALADAAALPSEVPEGLEPCELDGGRLQPARLIEDEVIVAMPLAPKHARRADCGSLARRVAEQDERSATLDR